MNLPLDSDLDFICCSSAFFFYFFNFEGDFLRKIRLLSFFVLFIYLFLFCNLSFLLSDVKNVLSLLTPPLSKTHLDQFSLSPFFFFFFEKLYRQTRLTP